MASLNALGAWRTALTHRPSCEGEAASVTAPLVAMGPFSHVAQQPDRAPRLSACSLTEGSLSKVVVCACGTTAQQDMERQDTGGRDSAKGLCQAVALQPRA
jgi:hypothetical protein